MKRLVLTFFAATSIAAAIQFAGFGRANAQSSATPPPAPPVPSAQATYVPTPVPTPMLPPGALPSPSSGSASATIPIGGRGRATPAPPKDEDANRVGISGVWEIAIQNSSGVVYTHFKLAQTGNVLTGQYLDTNGKKYPLSGTVEGKTVRVVVSMPNGTALVFNGDQEGGTDMVGTIDTAKDLVGFTAAYRPKYKWLDNLSPTPTGGAGTGVPY